MLFRPWWFSWMSLYIIYIIYFVILILCCWGILGWLFHIWKEEKTIKPSSSYLQFLMCHLLTHCSGHPVDNPYLWTFIKWWTLNAHLIIAPLGKLGARMYEPVSYSFMLFVYALICIVFTIEYPVSGSCVDKNALLISDVKGEWADWLKMIAKQQ